MVFLCTVEYKEVGVSYINTYMPGMHVVLSMFRPDTLWVLSPEIVVRISNPQERKQNNYGTISGMSLCITMCVCIHVCICFIHNYSLALSYSKARRSLFYLLG